MPSDYRRVYTGDILLLNLWRYSMNDELIAHYELWNEIEELHCSLTTLTDDEIIECKQALIGRVETALKLFEE